MIIEDQHDLSFRYKINVFLRRCNVSVIAYLFTKLTWLGNSESSFRFSIQAAPDAHLFTIGCDFVFCCFIVRFLLTFFIYANNLFVLFAIKTFTFLGAF